VLLIMGLKVLIVVVVVVSTILMVVSWLRYELVHLLLRASAEVIWTARIAVTHLHYVGLITV
jgi:hypothetical protein